MQPPAERAKLNPQDMVPLFRPTPRNEPVPDFCVVGLGYWMGMICGGAIATEKIELPANWGKLVEKYKDFVPTYVVY